MNVVNVVKPETSTEMFILSRIHVALEQLSISVTSTKSELSALTLARAIWSLFGIIDILLIALTVP